MLMRQPILQLGVFFLDEARRGVRRERMEAEEVDSTIQVAWWTRIGRSINRWEQRLRGTLDRIQTQPFVFFTRGDNVQNLNLVMLYIRENEHTNRVKFVSVYQDENEVPPRLAEHLAFLDEIYPEIDIEFVAVPCEFCPDLIDTLSKQLNIPTNLMFIVSPTGHLQYRLADLHGVRMII